jgi:hypothetical protein
VWGKHGVFTTECPRTAVTEVSVELVERYFAWKVWGGERIEERTAREMEAFSLLERESEKELRDERG